MIICEPNSVNLPTGRSILPLSLLFEEDVDFLPCLIALSRGKNRERGAVFEQELDKRFNFQRINSYCSN